MNNILIWYNQGLEYFTRNACSIYTLFMIIQLQWGIKFKNDFIIRTAKSAEKAKVWYESWGAYFQKIYDRFIEAIFAYTFIKVRVRTVNILSPEFEELFNRNYAFGLGLMYAGSWYRNSRKDGKITLEDVENFQGTHQYGHNHTYYKVSTKGGTTFDSLKTVTGKPVYMSLEVLRAAVKKGIYYQNARTLVLEDQRLDKWLRFFKKRGKVEMDNLYGLDKRAAERALKLRTFKK